MLDAPQIKLSSEAKSITADAFNSMIKEGRMLVILEGYVLDLEPYLSFHPGGAFVLAQRIGYNLDLPFNSYPYSGIESEEGYNEGHMHSNFARIIA